MSLQSKKNFFYVPDFVEIQRKSFLDFLELGLQEELIKRNPLRNFEKGIEFRFYPEFFKLKTPKYTIREAIFKGKTYDCELYVPIQLFDSQSNKISFKWFRLANLPFMTKRGHFIINGTPRVIINQLSRCPGVYFSQIVQKNKPPIYYADLIPQRGAWMRLEMDKKERIWVRLKKTPKISIIIFLQSMGLSKEIIFQSSHSPNILYKSLLKENHPKTMSLARDFLRSLIYKNSISDDNQLVQKFFFRKFYNPRTYNLGKFGRQNLNKKLALSISAETLTLTPQDILAATNYLLRLHSGLEKVDDIDNLKNRRLKTSGELLQNLIESGLMSLEKRIKKKEKENNQVKTFSYVELTTLMNKKLTDFFGCSPLSQFMDQTNPLAEITHKRRLTSLGPGGVSRETAGMAVRGIHPSHYGRICPIETPEGQNAGLVNSLTTFAKITREGFIQTPFLTVYRGQIQKNVSPIFFSVDQEQGVLIAAGDLRLSQFNFLPKTNVPVRQENEFKRVPSQKVDFMAISPVQMISVATALIPFLEHDDANRALMGSNMQRQAVPLIKAEAPIVGTGLEARVISDSGHGTQAEKSGYISYVSGQQVILETNYQSFWTQNVPLSCSQFLTDFWSTQPNMTSQVQRRQKNLTFFKIPSRQNNKKKISFFESRKINPLHVVQNTNVPHNNQDAFGFAAGQKLKYTIVTNKNHGFSYSSSTHAFYKNINQQAQVLKKCIFLQKLLQRQGVLHLCYSNDLAKKVKIENVHIFDHTLGFSQRPLKNGSHILSAKKHFIQINLPFKRNYNLAFYSRSFSKLRSDNRFRQEHNSTIFKKQGLHNNLAPKAEAIHSKFRFYWNYKFNNETISTKPEQDKKDESVKHSKLFESAFFNKILDFNPWSSVAVQPQHTKMPKAYGQIKNQNSVIFSQVYNFQNYLPTNQETFLIQKPSVQEGEWIQKGEFLTDGAASIHGELALGKNILIGYMPWEGYNFEDAIVISEKLIHHDIFTSLHIQCYSIEVQETELGLEQITKQLPEMDDSDIEHLDEKGVSKLGSWVQAGDILVGKITPRRKKELSPHEKLLYDIVGKQAPTTRNTSLRVPAGVEGRVVHIEILDTQNIDKHVVLDGPGHVDVYIAQKRKIQVGDKLAGRHGNKGVISRVLAIQDMPYLPDGTPLDMILNPLGVPSRMNVGQIFESLLGLAGFVLQEHYKILPFDEIAGPEASRSLVYSKLYEAGSKTGCNWLFEPNHPGKIKLCDGRNGVFFDQPVTVGRAYMLKLAHLVDKKIHARSTGPYALVTQQPLGGRSKHGGQRFGEMEVWALEGYGAAYILQELFTVKSDDIIGRQNLTESLLYNKPITYGTPESFKVLVRELQCLCLDIGIFALNSSGKRLEIDIMKVD